MTTPAPYELSVTLPRDARFAATVARVAEHAAQHAGHPESDALAFGRTVEAAVRGCIAQSANGDLPVIVRQTATALEILVSDQTLTLPR